MLTDMISGAPNTEVAEPRRPLLVGRRQSAADQPTSRPGKADDLPPTSKGGLQHQLTKRLLESALHSKTTNHLGYDKHNLADHNTGNGTRSERDYERVM